MENELKALREVKSRHSRELLARPGVSGVGVETDGHGRPSLVVHLDSDRPGVRLRGGCTLLIDLATAEVRYMVRKKVQSPDRLAVQLTLAVDAPGGLRSNYFASKPAAGEPFAVMHRVHG